MTTKLHPWLQNLANHTPFSFCWSLLKVYFAGHAHVKFILDIGMWVTELGMWVTAYELSTRCAASVLIRPGLTKKSKFYTDSQTLKNCLCLLLAEQMCDPCNWTKRIHYHFFQLLIVDSLHIIHFICFLCGWIIKHSLIKEFESNYEQLWKLVTLNSFLSAIRKTSSSRDIYFHTPSRNQTKLWPVQKYWL